LSSERRIDMFKRLVTITLVLLFCSALVAQASVLMLYPRDGALFGGPGDTVGWGFSLFNDSGFDLNVIRVYADSTLYSGGLGIFTDAVSGWSSSTGGLTVAPGETFTGTVTDGTPLATFTINPGASGRDAPVTGKIYLDYELIGGDGSTQTLTARFGDSDVTASVSVTPEPSTFILICLSLSVVGYARKTMKKPF
jgi:hypothetical protein